MAARRAGTWTDSLITVLALVFYATPLFWVALMLILLFSVWLDWLPSFGMGRSGPTNRLGCGLDVGAHLIMPAITLGLFYMAVYASMTRASMLEVASQTSSDRARQGRAGRPHPPPPHPAQRAAAGGHVGRYAGRQLIGGAMLMETVFAWPGIGRLVRCAAARDYKVLLGVFVCSSVLVVLFNLVTDLLYARSIRASDGVRHSRAMPATRARSPASPS